MILKLKHKKFYYVKFAFRLQTAGTDRYAIHNYHHHEKIYDNWNRVQRLSVAAINSSVIL